MNTPMTRLFVPALALLMVSVIPVAPARGQATFQGIGDLPGGPINSEAYGVTADGSFVVGVGETAILPEAFIWHATTGMQNLKAVLETEHGLDLTGWVLFEATDISDDGLTIVGFGLYQSIDLDGWIVTLPAPCLADSDGSGSVNVTDLLALLASWGPCPAPCPSDFDSSGSVNVTDLLALLAAWGPCP